MSIRLQLFTGFFILILVFIIDFWVNQRFSNVIVKNTTYLNNSESVIRNSNILHKEMIEMQSGFRGFLLTGQEVFLQPYYEGIDAVPTIITEQRLLISSFSQKLRLDSIIYLHDQWVHYANSLITTKLDTLPETSQKYKQLFETKLKMEVGKKLNDKIQSVFKSFDNYEYKLRQERREALQKSLKNTSQVTLALTILSIFIAISFGFYFIRTITSRISKMVSLAEKITKGDFQTIEDTKKDELNKLSVSLNSMSQTLEKNFKELTKKNRELDQFAYVVSHDLKAPLRGISNIVLWIEEDNYNEASAEMKRNLNLIKGRAIRLENMINGLLEYAKIGKILKGTEKVNIKKLIYEIQEILVPENYELYIDGVMPFITTEKLHLEQVFSNLISNAVKYNQNVNPKIIIKLRELEEFYEFTITDNGQGIEKEYYDKIFVIFQTLQERDAFESTGIGLAIVKKIIEDYKGSIKVESEIGKGTSFTFTWPKN